MSFVLDASIAACWALSDESHPHADLAFARIRTDEALVPSLWWFEMRNILIMNERRKRIAAPDTAAFLRNLSQLRLRIDYAPSEAEIFRLARTYQLSVYDAAYLELAERHTAPLATLDKALASAARAEKAALIDEVAATELGQSAT